VTRSAIPRAIRAKVLDEYRHRCAVCAADRPQLHHIDEDPSNHHPQNLLPLCPNCHLGDQHDPTATPDREKLKLFRRYKSPAILDERFHPIWTRCAFLADPATQTTDELAAAANELELFVFQFEKGDFYARRVSDLLGPIGHFRIVTDDERAARAEAERDHAEYVAKLETGRDEALRLIVEMLRYQNWLPQSQQQRPRDTR
jgi:hypothetical protein